MGFCQTVYSGSPVSINGDSEANLFVVGHLFLSLAHTRQSIGFDHGNGNSVQPRDTFRLDPIRQADPAEACATVAGGAAVADATDNPNESLRLSLLEALAGATVAGDAAVANAAQKASHERLIRPIERYST